MAVDPTGEAPRRGARAAALLLLALVAILLCLIPKPENDLFFELRIGDDILRSGQLPHFDTYSWTNRGTRWDVPEWLSFVLYALAHRLGGFFGVWLLMTGLTLAAAAVVWRALAGHLNLAWAWALTALMLLALSPFLQERPYAFTYLFLAVSVATLTRARERDRPRLLLWLPPLCALWTNLHQGVVVLPGLLLVCALGDALTASAIRVQVARADPPDLLTDAGLARAQQDDARRTQAQSQARRAGLMLGTALACALTVMLSPYGWRVYWNIFVTLRDPRLMSNVTEWNPVWAVPPAQLGPFVLLVAALFGALAGSRRRNLTDTLALAALLGEAILHARHIALLAVAGTIIAAPHFASVREQLQRLRPPSRRALFPVGALLFTLLVGLASAMQLRRSVGPLGYSPEGIGQAAARVPDYPSGACAFMEAEGFPPDLRLLNNFEIGGYLMWRLPRQPVFIDGRLDVYAGRTFDDNLVLARAPGSPVGAALIKRYDFDCVLTTSGRQGRAFLSDPQWQLVYQSPPRPGRPRARLLLRRRPQFAALLARCLKDQGPLPRVH